VIQLQVQIAHFSGALQVKDTKIEAIAPLLQDLGCGNINACTLSDECITISARTRASSDSDAGNEDSMPKLTLAVLLELEAVAL